MRRFLCNTKRFFLMILILSLSIFYAGSISAKAAKKPGKTKITSCRAKDNKITLTWKKAKRAKYYRIFAQEGGDKWKFFKTVKKSAANKKKYSNKFKFKRKSKGKKYKIYKQKHPFKPVAKKVKKLKYTFAGKYDKQYRFYVQAVNGKKVSKASSVVKIKTPKNNSIVDPSENPDNPANPDNPTNPDDPANPDNPSNPDDPANPDNPSNPDDPANPDNPADPGDQEPREYKITYNLDGGVNNPLNPSKYTLGDTFDLQDPTKTGYVFEGWFRDSAHMKQITSITASYSGNLTLYAKWHLEAQNIQAEGLDDMIWSWWYHPQVVSSGNKTFWGFATKEGYCGVACYDSTTGKVEKTLLKQASAVDDHNGLGLTILDNKRIMCVYAGGHNSDKELHIRISDKPLDISSFETDISLSSVGVTCYGQIVRNNGKYYLFYRVNNNSWAYRTSVDGTEWTDEVIMIKAPMQYYCKCVPTTNDNLIRILMYSNPTSNAPEIRMGFLDTSTEDHVVVNADGKSMVGFENLDYSDFTILQNVETDKTQRLFDAAVTAPDKPRFLYASFTPAKSKSDSVYYIYNAGQSYKICEGGAALWDPKYQLGASFMGNSRIAAARNDNGTDYVELYEFTGSKVVRVKEVFSNYVKDSIRAGRPIVDVNGKAVLWHFGYYNNSSYRDFDTSAIMYLTSEGIVVGDNREPTVPGQTEYTITYVLNGGVNHEDNPESYTYGDEIELKDPTKEDYDFLGWYTDSKCTNKITRITSKTEGDLTLYAKWYLHDLTVDDASLDDMCWSWWTYPQVVSDGKKTFWGYTTKEGYCGVAVYNDETNKVSTTVLKKAFSIGDTNAPAVMLMDDKRILCAYSQTETTRKELHIRISKNPLDISSFEDITLSAGNIAQYAQIMKSNGRYYLFYHYGSNGSWAYRTSEDGINWSTTDKILIYETKIQYYCRFMPTTDDTRIRILMSANPDTDPALDESGDSPRAIRMGFLNTIDNCMYNANGVQVGETKASYKDFDILQDVTEGKTLRVLDAAVTDPSQPRFVYSEFTYEKGVKDPVYYLNDGGQSRKICDAGTPLLDPKFQLGATFVTKDKLVVARNDMETNTDYIETYVYDGSAITFEKELYKQVVSDKKRAARPIVDVNGNAIIWHVGKYNSSNSFTTSAVLHLMNRDGLVGTE